MKLINEEVEAYTVGTQLADFTIIIGFSAILAWILIDKVIGADNFIQIVANWF